MTDKELEEAVIGDFVSIESLEVSPLNPAFADNIIMP